MLNVLKRKVLIGFAVMGFVGLPFLLLTAIRLTVATLGLGQDGLISSLEKLMFGNPIVTTVTLVSLVWITLGRKLQINEAFEEQSKAARVAKNWTVGAATNRIVSHVRQFATKSPALNEKSALLCASVLIGCGAVALTMLQVSSELKQTRKQQWMTWLTTKEGQQYRQQQRQTWYLSEEGKRFLALQRNCSEVAAQVHRVNDTQVSGTLLKLGIKLRLSPAKEPDELIVTQAMAAVELDICREKLAEFQLPD
jgi:hypothetical protein